MHLSNAALPLHEAVALAWLGLCVGVCVSLSWFATLSILKAFRQRTKRWIILGGLGGLFMLAAWVLVVGVAIAATTSIHKDSKTPPPPPATSKVAQTIQGQAASYHFVLPADWQVDWGSKSFDVTATCGELHLGIVAARTVGTSGVIAKMARDRIKKEAAECKLSSVTSTEIDGHNWLCFDAAFRYPEGPAQHFYQYTVYSGDEGMFQVIGWRTQRSLSEHDTSTLRDIARSFQLPAWDNLSRATAPATTLSRTEIVQGTRAAYHLTIPIGWQVQRRGSNDFDLQASLGRLHVGVLVEPGVATSSEELLRFVQDRARRKEDNPRLSKPTALQIDNHEWLHFTEEFQYEGVELLEENYVYAGPEGAFQILGLTHLSDYPVDEGALRELATSFRFPPTAESTPQTIQGKEAAYRLTIPAGWRAKYPSSDFDVLASCGNTFFAVTVQSGTLGTTSSLVNTLQERLRKITKNFRAGEIESAEIDGRDWLRYTNRYDYDGVSYAYLKHAYVGPEGTFQLLGWTTQETYEQNAKILNEIATSFRFPGPAGPVASAMIPPPQPSPSSTAIPVGTSARKKFKTAP